VGDDIVENISFKAFWLCRICLGRRSPLRVLLIRSTFGASEGSYRYVGSARDAGLHGDGVVNVSASGAPSWTLQDIVYEILRCPGVLSVAAVGMESQGIDSKPLTSECIAARYDSAVSPLLFASLLIAFSTPVPC
jgi:hypothetical protein